MSLLLLLSLSWAQDPKPVRTAGDGPAFSLPCEWPVGQSATYTFESETRGPGVTGWRAVKGINDLTVTVRAAGVPQTVDYVSSGMRFEGKPEDVARRKEIFGDQASQTQSLVMAGAQIRRLENYAELVPETVASVRRMEPDPTRAARIIAMFDDENIGAPALLEEPVRFFAFGCLEGNQGLHVSIPHEVPGPRGTPIVRWRTVDVARVDADSVTLTAHHASDPRSAPEIDTVETVSGLMSTTDGWPIRLELVRTTGTEGHPAHTVERWTWTRRP